MGDIWNMEQNESRRYTNTAMTNQIDRLQWASLIDIMAPSLQQLLKMPKTGSPVK